MPVQLRGYPVGWDVGVWREWWTARRAWREREYGPDVALDRWLDDVSGFYARRRAAHLREN